MNLTEMIISRMMEKRANAVPAMPVRPNTNNNNTQATTNPQKVYDPQGNIVIEGYEPVYDRNGGIKNYRRVYDLPREYIRHNTLPSTREPIRYMEPSHYRISPRYREHLQQRLRNIQQGIGMA